MNSMTDNNYTENQIQKAFEIASRSFWDALKGHIKEDIKFPIWKTIEIGGKTKKQLEKELDKFNVSEYAKAIMNHKDFTVQKKVESINLVRLTVRELGFMNFATTDQIFQKASELGLELCPAEVGPHLRFIYTDQPIGEWFSIAMEPISDPDGRPGVFDLKRRGDGVWLSSFWAEPGDRWNPGGGIVFQVPSPRK